MSAFGAGMAIVSLMQMGGTRMEGSKALLTGVIIGGALMIAANTGFLGITWGFVKFLGWIGFAIVILGYILGVGKSASTGPSKSG